jgi:hypothetical protein
MTFYGMVKLKLVNDLISFPQDATRWHPVTPGLVIFLPRASVNRCFAKVLRFAIVPPIPAPA